MTSGCRPIIVYICGESKGLFAHGGISNVSSVNVSIMSMKCKLYQIAFKIYRISRIVLSTSQQEMMYMVSAL